MNNELDYFFENNATIEKNTIKSNNYYKYQVLSMMTNNDIAEIIIDKGRELKEEKLDNKKNIVELHLRGDSRLMCIGFSEDRQQGLQKIIKQLQFELNQRNPYTTNTQVSLEQLKDQIDIVTFIEMITGETPNTRRLNKCYFPNHKDNTASMKVYEHTNSFYCNGCHKGGDHITFIQHYYNIDTKQAIIKFRSLFNK